MRITSRVNAPRVRVTIEARVNGRDVTVVGKAKCSPDDVFSGNVGLLIAGGRALTLLGQLIERAGVESGVSRVELAKVMALLLEDDVANGTATLESPAIEVPLDDLPTVQEYGEAKIIKDLGLDRVAGCDCDGCRVEEEVEEAVAEFETAEALERRDCEVCGFSHS